MINGDIQLICIPYAGGSASIYNKWVSILPKGIEVIPYELAGRGKRFSEPFCSTYESVIDELFDFVNGINKPNIALWGHSMGALLVYGLATKMQEHGLPAPLHMFISGRYPPNISSARKQLHNMPEEEFKQEISKMGGTPSEILENKELWELFSRILRADYTILENYKYQQSKQKLSSDMTVFYGADDDEVNNYGVSGWETFTNGNCRYIQCEGGHFFFKNQETKILSIIEDVLKKYTV